MLCLQKLVPNFVYAKLSYKTLRIIAAPHGSAASPAGKSDKWTETWPRNAMYHSGLLSYDLPV
jgi:GH15 family glucan-1,4-alpha-glucosidase